MRLFIGICALLAIFAAFPAGATSCMRSFCMEYLVRHDLVFKGKAVASGETTAEMREEFARNKNTDDSGMKELPDTYTDFEVSALYKGVAGKTARIYYSSHRRGGIIGDFDVRAYADGTEAVIYASRAGGFFMTYRGLCSGCSGEGELETVRAQHAAIDALIAQYPQTLEFYTKKVTLSEQYKDYAAAAAAYEKAFEAVPGAKDNADLKAQYGRVLHLGGRAADAVKVLEGVKGAKGADTGLQLGLLRLGRISELSGKKLSLAGQELQNIEIKDADFTDADFKGAKLAGVTFINVTLKNADFTGAHLSAQMADSNLQGAKFDGAKIQGKFLKNNFDGASFTKSEADLRIGDGNSFKGADFTGAKFFIAECSGIAKDAIGNDFTNAVFKDATMSGLYKSSVAGADMTGMKFHTGRCGPHNQGIDLSGRNLDGLQFDNVDFTSASFKGASLKKATFPGATLTGADFTGADLTEASFPINSYRGQVKMEGADFTGAKIAGVTWTGALFDCKTKFPAGFDPAANDMAIKDTSCEAGKPKNPGVVDYDKERLAKGYMTVCNGDYHADCIYGFLASFAVKTVDWSYQREHTGLARSFVEAGYPALAKVMALKAIGGIALSRHSLDPKFFAEWTPIMEAVEAAEQGRAPAKAALKPKRVRNAQGSEAQQLAEKSLESAEEGDFTQALSYAAQIGDAAYNRDVLKWPDTESAAPPPGGAFYHVQREYTSALTAIALERKRQEKDEAANKRYLADIESRGEKRRNGVADRSSFAPLDVLAGAEPVLDENRRYYENPELLAAAYAVTDKADKAWEIHAKLAAADTGRGMRVLAALADVYAARPEDPGMQKLLEALEKAGLESWPQDGDKVRAGFEADIYGSFFDIAGKVKAQKIVDGILARAEAYKNEHLKTRIGLFAATALARMGNTAKALPLFEKAQQAALAAEPPPEGRGMPKHMILLTPMGSISMGQQMPVILQDREIGAFIIAFAASGAATADKQKVLDAGSALLEKGKAGSPLFRAQLAVATAAALKDAASGQKMKDAQYGMPPLAFAELLHDAGFHVAEKQLLEAAWASGNAPHSFGLERLAFRRGRDNNMVAVSLARLFVRDGHFDAAEQAAWAMVTPATARRVGGTDYAAYFWRQKAFHDVAAAAVGQGKAGVALDIARAKLTYAPYQAAVYFALANAEKNPGEARKHYDAGLALTPGFGDAMGAPLVDPEGLALEALIARAAAEKKLGLAANLDKTLSFAKQAAAVAEHDVQRGKTSHVAERVAQIAAGEGGAKESMADFTARLKIRDDLNSTSVVAEMAEKYLAAGDREKARAIALYGMRNIDSYPQASGKKLVLLPYASIIARTEERMSEDSQRKIEAILRQVHSNVPGGKAPDAEAAKTDFIGEGEKAYAELKRRNAMDAAPPDDGSDRLTKLERDGSISRQGGEALMKQWLAGATKKYQEAHPGQPVPAIEPIDNQSYHISQYGIINKEITMPSQAYGGPINKRYVVPADVPRPKGPRHETTIFYMKDFTCEGNFPPFCKY